MVQSITKEHIFHSQSVQQTAQILGVDLTRGLTDREVKNRRKLGKNTLPKERKFSKLGIFFNQFKSPLIYILLGAGLITLLLKHLADATVILVAVALNAIVGYIQEAKASNTLRELKKVLKVKAIVIRNGREQEISQEDLVVGDLIILKAGNKVPADGRIVEAWNLKANEAALTGEWLVAEKNSKKIDQGITLADRDNMVYMATTIEDGEGKAIVTGIGKKTEIGKIASLIKETKEEKTPYQKKLAKFSKIIGILVLVFSALIFVEGIIVGKPFLEMFITVVAVAVAAIPEGLPIAMTVILALGMQRILKRKGLVRKLASAETLGSTSIIATDKTLTLTEGKMEVAAVKGESEEAIWQIATLANEAFIENPEDDFEKWRIKGRPTDKALVLGSGRAGYLKPVLEKAFNKIGEIPFNSTNKFIAVLRGRSTSATLYVAGAPEKMIALSKRIKTKTGSIVLSKARVIKLNKELEDLTRKGLRVIAVASKPLKFKKGEDINIKKEQVNDLIFTGFIGLKDPVRKEAKKAFKLCSQAGLRPIIVTGDHLLTAKAVAEELGLETKKENMMLGNELDKLSDKQLASKLKNINLFARVEPRHKLRIIEAWQAKNHVVAMTGDGINDAPALKKADIGVALGSGTDVAKDVSDLVLLDDNFAVLVAAVEEGRAILDNIRKVITYLLAGSFTSIILIGVTLLFKVPLPLLAVQILWVNLIEDGLPNIALAFEEKEKDLMKQKPNNHKAGLLNQEMKTIIIVISIFTSVLLLGLFFYLYKFTNYSIEYIRTMIFVGLTIGSLLYIFSCKSLRKNIWHINILSNKYLVGAWAFGVFALVGGVYLPPLQTLLKTVPIGIYDWIILIGLGFLNLVLIEGIKYYFIVRHKTSI